MYLSVADIANPYCIGCCCRTWISLDIAHFYEDQYQLSKGFARPACPFAGGMRVDPICATDCQPAVTAPPRVGCVVWRPSIAITAFKSPQTPHSPHRVPTQTKDDHMTIHTTQAHRPSSKGDKNLIILQVNINVIKNKLGEQHTCKHHHKSGNQAHP